MWRSILLLASICTSPAGAIFLEPSTAPADRLIRNLEAYLAIHPQDTRALYRLGRIHYHVFATKQQTTYSYYGKEIPSIAHDRPGRVHPSYWLLHLTLPAKRLAHHWLEAWGYLRKALELESAGGLYDLTLGCLHEDLIPLRETLSPFIHRTEDELKATAISHYAAAFLHSSSLDAARQEFPSYLDPPMLSLEAAESYLRLVPDGPLAARMREHIAAIKKLPQSLKVTPIILSLRPSATFSTLIHPNLISTFDLDGTGRRQRWPWLAPHTSLLVWDPHRTGKITSGRQLFGSVTWWMFWTNGYQALAALDDNQDGWLRGSELTGLALWFDRNQNAISEPGEVHAIEEYITALRVTHDTTEPGGSLRATNGAQLRDGTPIHTWDWITSPLP